MKLKDGFDSNYRYILVAARRARQLSGGAPRLVTTAARKPSKIDAGRIQYLVKGKDGTEAAAAVDESKEEENK